MIKYFLYQTPTIESIKQKMKSNNKDILFQKLSFKTVDKNNSFAQIMPQYQSTNKRKSLGLFENKFPPIGALDSYFHPANFNFQIKQNTGAQSMEVLIKSPIIHQKQKKQVTSSQNSLYIEKVVPQNSSKEVIILLEKLFLNKSAIIHQKPKKQVTPSQKSLFIQKAAPQNSSKKPAVTLFQRLSLIKSPIIYQQLKKQNILLQNPSFFCNPTPQIISVQKINFNSACENQSKSSFNYPAAPTNISKVQMPKLYKPVYPPFLDEDIENSSQAHQFNQKILELQQLQYLFDLDFDSISKLEYQTEEPYIIYGCRIIYSLYRTMQKPFLLQSAKQSWYQLDLAYSMRYKLQLIKQYKHKALFDYV